MRKYYYDAFISYRHKELDSFVAEKIHKSLERYHIPKRIQKVSGKKKIERVFRDREELPTSSSLADNIKTALENSEYLIVICSPDVIESQWVQQEIDLFLETHSRDKILAVLISGEPDESFPERIRIAKEEVTDEEGNKTVVSKMIEPLAADIRAGSKKEMEKKLKTEILRLLAPILSCSYDDLRQRHREYVMQKTMIAAGVVSCLALSFTVYALHQAARIKEQYQKALENESQYLSEVSGSLMETGDRMGALENALAALPKDEKDDRPLVPEAVFALNNALYSYNHDGKLYFKPDRMLEPDSQIEYSAGFSTDDSYYMEIDRTGSAYFYNGRDGKLYWKVDGEAFLKGGFFSDKKAAMLTKEQVVFLDLEKKEVTYTVSLDKEISYSSPELLVNEKYIAVMPAQGQIMICETSSGKIVYQKDSKEDEMKVVSLKCWNEEGSVLAVEAANREAALGETETDIILLTVETGEEEYIKKPGDEVCEAAFLDENRIAILESRVLEKYSDNRVSQVRVYDCASKDDIWVSDEYESHTSYFDTGLFAEKMAQDGSEKKVLGFYVNDLLVLADEKTSENFVEAYFPDMIVGVGRYDNEKLLVGTQDGGIRVQTLDYNDIPQYAGKVSNRISAFQYNETDQMVIQGLRAGNAAIVSRLYEDEGMKPIETDKKGEIAIPETEENQEDNQVGHTKNIKAVYEDAKIQVLDIESGKVLKEIPFYGETVCKYAFVNDDSHLLMYGDNQKLTLWNIEEEKAVMERKEEFTFFDEFQVDPAGKYFAVKENAGYTEAGAVTGRIKVYTLDMEKEEFYPYANVPGGWISFESNEIGCVDIEGKAYVSPIRSLEELRKQGMKILE